MLIFTGIKNNNNLIIINKKIIFWFLIFLFLILNIFFLIKNKKEIKHINEIINIVLILKKEIKNREDKVPKAEPDKL